MTKTKTNMKISIVERAADLGKYCIEHSDEREYLA